MNLRFFQIGWTAAAALAAVIFVSGFQGTTEKIGVINVQKLVTGSNYGKASQAEIDKLSAARKAMLQFVTENPVMTVDEAQKYRELSIKKDPLTADEQVKLATIRQSATDNTKKLSDLTKKENQTPDEKTLVGELNDRAGRTIQAIRAWAQEFQQEVQSFGEGQYNLTMERVQSAIQETAKAQAFTAVFDTRYAPYGAQDITDTCLTAMNAKK